MKKPRWTTLLAPLALAAAIAGGVFIYQNRPLTVPVARVEENVPIKVFGLGTVEARVISRLGFKVAGTLAELRADHGDHVRSGDLLARIDSREQDARVAKARAQLLSAEAAVQVAEAAGRKAATLAAQRTQTNQRRQALVARQAISIEAAEEAEMNEAAAKADLAVAQSEIAAAKARFDDARAQHEFERVILGQHDLRAPFDGFIASRAKELGAVVSAGETLFTLVDPATVWMLAYIDEVRAGSIQVGQPAEIRLRSLPQDSFKGRVTRIGVESDRVNEERRVYVACDDCPEAFFLGEQAEVYITTSIASRALLVPESAIAQSDGASGVVWTVEDGRLRQRRVTLGRRTLDSRIEVSGDIPAGARVAAATSAQYHEGRAARVAEAGR